MVVEKSLRAKLSGEIDHETIQKWQIGIVGIISDKSAKELARWIDLDNLHEWVDQLLSEWWELFE